MLAQQGEPLRSGDFLSFVGPAQELDERADLAADAQLLPDFAQLVLQRRRHDERTPSPLGRALTAFLTFHFVCFGWIFFRSADFAHVSAILDRLFVGGTGAANVPTMVYVVLGLVLLGHALPSRWAERLSAAFVRMPAVAQAAAALAMTFLLNHFRVSDVVPFIYFQF